MCLERVLYTKQRHRREEEPRLSATRESWGSNRDPALRKLTEKIFFNSIKTKNSRQMVGENELGKHIPQETTTMSRKPKDRVLAHSEHDVECPPPEGQTAFL